MEVVGAAPIVEAHAEERSTKHQRGGSWRGVEAVNTALVVEVPAWRQLVQSRGRRGGGAGTGEYVTGK
jgi:hypothetical protein